MQVEYNFDSMTATPLCEIMDRNGSDKGKPNIYHAWHNYTTFYYSIFNPIKNEKLRIFELGLGSKNHNIPSNMAGATTCKPGGSLYGWKEFFPNAMVYGADIDTDIIFEEERIKTYYCDQTNAHVIKYMWREEELDGDMDIIIDDGLHEFAANVMFFENSIHKLAKNGYFIIEDIRKLEMDLFNEKVEEWKVKYPKYSFTMVKIYSPWNNLDNNLLVVKYV
jgi:hypothetical protein